MEDEQLEKLETGRRKFKTTPLRTDVGKHPSDVNKTGNPSSMKSNPGTDLLQIFNRDVNKLLQDDEQIWNYFEPCVDSIHHAICTFCNKKLSLNKNKFGRGSGPYGMIYHTQSRHPQEFNKLSIAASFKTPIKQKQSIFPQKSYSEQSKIHPIPYNRQQMNMKTRSAAKTLTKSDSIPYRKMLPRSVTVTKLNPIPYRKKMLQDDDDEQIWDFFEPCLDSTNRVICKFCNSELSSNKAIFGKGSGSYGMMYHISQRHPQEFQKLPMAATFQTPKQKKSILALQKSYSEPPKNQHPISYSQQMKARFAQMSTRSAANTMTPPSKTVQFFNAANTGAKIHPIPNKKQMKTREPWTRSDSGTTKQMKTRSAANITENVQIFQCRFCDYTSKEKNLKNHVLNHFKDQLNPFIPVNSLQCPECPQKSRDRITLLRHYAFTHRMFFKFGTEDDLKARLPNSEPVIVQEEDGVIIQEEDGRPWGSHFLGEIID